MHLCPQTQKPPERYNYLNEGLANDTTRKTSLIGVSPLEICEHDKKYKSSATMINAVQSFQLCIGQPLASEMAEIL